MPRMSYGKMFLLRMLSISKISSQRKVFVFLGFANCTGFHTKNWLQPLVIGNGAPEFRSTES